MWQRRAEAPPSITARGRGGSGSGSLLIEKLQGLKEGVEKSAFGSKVLGRYSRVGEKGMEGEWSESSRGSSRLP